MGNGPPFNFLQTLQNLRRTPGQQPTLQPTPQDYADALEAYGRQQPIRTPGALASNLAADAINRLGASNQQPASPMQFNLPTSVDPQTLGLQPSPLTVGQLPPIGSGQ